MRKVFELLTNCQRLKMAAEDGKKHLTEGIEVSEMDYQVIEKNNRKYIGLDATGALIQNERDALDLISLCMENSINLLLIPGERLSDEFFNLKTGTAGAILQKFMQYGVKAAVILDKGRCQGRFRDLMIESNRGNMFRVYESQDEAAAWLVSDMINC